MSQGNDDLVAMVARRACGYLDGGPRSPRVLQAMREVDRADFLTGYEKSAAYDDEALPIGSGQTCSQPSMVAFMLDKLELRNGMRVLEVGSGSGYAASVASRLCSPDGQVIACEIVPELAVHCRSNTARFGRDIRVLEADGSFCLPEHGPFDRIFLSAGVFNPGFDESPFLDCLAADGILLYPEATGSLHRVVKSPSALRRDSWYGVTFVPLTGKSGQRGG